MDGKTNKKTWQGHICGKLKFLKRKIVFAKDAVPELYFFLHMLDSATFTVLKEKNEDYILLYSWNSSLCVTSS